MRALLVEKNHTVRDLVKVALQQFDGVTVDLAEDTWALDLVKENPYDLLIVDENLAGTGDGTELLREIRGLGTKAPAILLVHGPVDASRSAAIDLDVAAALAVPLDTVEVFKTLVSVLRKVDTRATR